MKIALLILTLYGSIVLAQFPSGGGYVKEMHDAQIQFVSEYYFEHDDSTFHDTIFRYKKEFNANGQLIREEFNSIYNSTCNYEYYYNDSGKVIRIDTSGFCGYGYFQADTNFSEPQIIKTYEQKDTLNLILTEVLIGEDFAVETTYSYNDSGQLSQVHTRLDSAGIIMLSQVVYYYDDDGLLTQKNIYQYDNYSSFKLQCGYFYKYTKFN